MKKFLFFILICICIPIYAYADGSDGIKVGLYYGSTAKQSINIDGVEYKAEDITEPVHAGTEWVNIDGKQYRGSASLIKNPEGLINVINNVSLEEYISGCSA